MLSKVSFMIANTAFIIFHQERGVKKTPNHRYAHFHEMLSNDICILRNMVGIAVESLLNKLLTWQICTGLRSETTTAIITNC